MGRPRKYFTEEERKQAKKQANKKYMEKPGIKEKTAKTRKIRLAKPDVRERERARYSSYNRKYAAEHKDRINEQQNERNKNNPEYNPNRNASRNSNTRKQRETLLKILGGEKCVQCGFDDRFALVVGHIHDTGHLDNLRFKDDRKRNDYYCIHPLEARENLVVQCCNCNEIQEYERREKNWNESEHKESEHKKKQERIECKKKLWEILGGPICILCGFTDQRALTKGHKVDRDGLPRTKTEYDVNHPEETIKTYQVECANCNNAKERRKYD